jgi:hypothetical protein
MTGQEEFPLLAKFWSANCPFPATSTSAERVFNQDKLALDPQRWFSFSNYLSFIIYHVIIFINKTFQPPCSAEGLWLRPEPRTR